MRTSEKMLKSKLKRLQNDRPVPKRDFDKELAVLKKEFNAKIADLQRQIDTLSGRPE